MSSKRLHSCLSEAVYFREVLVSGELYLYTLPKCATNPAWSTRCALLLKATSESGESGRLQGFTIFFLRGDRNIFVEKEREEEEEDALEEKP